ncbi:DUF6438 domain-containing protein [Hymenobacter guriensis]|uniref:DUF6438 domain-containing protein n=1 Tax=Hymenobacter guriensis TaxID=2793065 RepID=A0ABS0L743_9BACT|nr:DUF6438 domain-containing protein [Hymenobacter guriensis]MBG8555343.1 hypothetical protein [Hymenobacter guriensis]
MRLLAFSLLTFLLSGACAQRSTSAAQSNLTAQGTATEATAAPQSEGPALIFRKTPCFGTCPAYTATIYADGRVEYEGQSNVPLTGTHQLRLPADTVAYIRREADRIGFAKLRPVYTANISDVPSTYLTMPQPDGTMKEVRVDVDAPAELTKLLEYIHRQVKSVAVAKK